MEIRCVREIIVDIDIDVKSQSDGPPYGLASLVRISTVEKLRRTYITPSSSYLLYALYFVLHIVNEVFFLLLRSAQYSRDAFSQLIIC